MATIKLDTTGFREKIFDYTTDQDWNYKGPLPAIVDFYADWCGPCKMIAPVLEELAEEYKDRLVIYKVDTEAEPELSGVFGIRSIPTFLFIPVGADPMMQAGAFPKHIFRQVIEEKLLIQEQKS